MVMIIKMHGRKFERVKATKMCAGCVAYEVRNRICCQTINDLAREQHPVTHCINAEMIYVEVTDDVTTSTDS